MSLKEVRLPASAAATGGLSDTRVPIHRTEDGIAYDRFRRSIVTQQRDPALEETFREINQEFVDMRVSPGEVHVNEVLTNLSVMYRNDAFIGSQLMPPVFTGGKLSGTFYTYTKRDRFAYPDDDMTDRSEPNELNQSRSTDTYSLTTRSLVEWLDFLTIQNQDAPLNELMDCTENVMEGLAFKREQRQATVLTTSGNFGSNTSAIAAADRWDSGSGGDPLGAVDDALAAMWEGRGQTMVIGYCGLQVWNVLKRHAQILDRIKYGGTSATPATVSAAAVASLMELDLLLVGKGRQDTANEGQSASYSRIWGTDTFGIVRVMQRPTIRNAAFGVTFQDTPSQTDQFWMPERFSKGAYKCRASHSDQEKVIAADTGYLYTTVRG